MKSPFSRLHGKFVKMGKKDRLLVWIGSRNGSWENLPILFQSQGIQFLSLKAFQKFILYVPTKVSFFHLGSLLEDVLTLEQLQRRGWSLANKCYLCKNEVEPTDHIPLHCPKASEIWHLLFALFRVTQVLPLSVKEDLLSQHDSFVGRKRNKVWKVVPLCILTLWKKKPKSV